MLQWNENPNYKNILGGVQLLRDVVIWADNQDEETHDNQTPEEIIQRYLAALKED
jgi:hypothetical protein